MKSKILCAWCDRFLGYTKAAGGLTSHGICRQCLMTHFGLTPEQLEGKNVQVRKKETHP